MPNDFLLVGMNQMKGYADCFVGHTQHHTNLCFCRINPQWTAKQLHCWRRILWQSWDENDMETSFLVKTLPTFIQGRPIKQKMCFCILLRKNLPTVKEMTSELFSTPPHSMGHTKSNPSKLRTLRNGTQC
jgi:hypothetical protein